MIAKYKRMVNEANRVYILSGSARDKDYLEYLQRRLKTYES